MISNSYSFSSLRTFVYITVFASVWQWMCYLNDYFFRLSFRSADVCKYFQFSCATFSSFSRVDGCECVRYMLLVSQFMQNISFYFTQIYKPWFSCSHCKMRWKQTKTNTNSHMRLMKKMLFLVTVLFFFMLNI